MTAVLAHITRHPIKAHGREALASVMLSAGACLPFDRHWAVAHAASKFDPEQPQWTPCGHFQRAARTQSLMAMEAAFDAAKTQLTLRHPALGEITFTPDDAQDAERFITWLAPISPTDQFRPARLVSVPGCALTDSDFPSVSIANLASNAALAAHMGQDLSIHRWRANLWLDGLEPWVEADWIGREIRIGGALLRVVEPITRCKATTANPETGLVDADTLGALRGLRGAQQFAVYARVLDGGIIRRGDRAELL